MTLDFGAQMKFNNFTIVIADLPDRDQKVVEIICEKYQWVEISKEKDNVIVQFYGYEEKKCGNLPLIRL